MARKSKAWDYQDLICKRYLAGESMKDIAVTYRIDKNTIWNILKNNGVQRRSKGGKPKVTMPIEQAYKDEAVTVKPQEVYYGGKRYYDLTPFFLESYDKEPVFVKYVTKGEALLKQIMYGSLNISERGIKEWGLTAQKQKHL